MIQLPEPKRLEKFRRSLAEITVGVIGWSIILLKNAPHLRIT